MERGGQSGSQQPEPARQGTAQCIGIEVFAFDGAGCTPSEVSTSS
jgi:hypothetical protein